MLGWEAKPWVYSGLAGSGLLGGDEGGRAHAGHPPPPLPLPPPRHTQPHFPGL